MAILLAVLVSLATIIVVGMLMFVFTITAPAVDSAKAHLDDLRVGKIEDAYNATAQAFKSETPLPEYKKFLEQYPALQHVRELSLGDRSLQNQRVSLKGTVTTTENAVLPISIRLVHEGGQWRILGIEVEAAGAH